MVEPSVKASIFKTKNFQVGLIGTPATIKSGAWQKALKKAAEVPMKTAECCFELLKLASRLGEIGNPRLISDVGVGALLAQAALESAVLNVEINLSYIKNHEYIKKKKESLVFFSKEGKKLATEIVEKVREEVVR